MSVNKLLELGNDQISNMFNLVFPEGLPVGDSERVELRIDSAIALPDENINEWVYWHKGVKIVKPGRQEQTDKKLIIPVRIDSEWKVFSDLELYKRMCFDETNATALMGALLRTRIMIQPLKYDKSIAKTLTFNGCYLIGMKVDDLDPANSGPVRVTLTFIYNSRS